MKKGLGILLCVLLAAGLAGAEEAAKDGGATLTGRITEMREGGDFLVETLSDGQAVEVRVPEGVTYEADWAIGAGDVVLVEYDGRMTRSMPGQINAQAIHSYSLEGFVEEIDEDLGRALLNTPQVGQVWVTMPEGVDAAQFADGEVRVFYNGVMAMSLPGQAHALTIEAVQVATGNVKEMGGGYFLMDDGGTEIRVNFDDHTKVAGNFDVGDAVEVFHGGAMSSSLPPQVYAQVIASIETEG